MNDIISSRWLHACGAALMLLCFDIRPAQAVAITLGSRIDITASTFALPIQIVDAVGVSEWFLDLTYDPTDVQVNLGCDPFGGDSYCSLLTGPVTEGEFFAAGAPFNLLIPGFVELDPVTLMQTGRLFGMHGAFGGLLPAPSGNGILAYIEFTLLGAGDSSIDGNGTTDGDGTVVPVTEPGTLVPFAIAFAWLIGRRIFMRAGRRTSENSLAICRSPHFGAYRRRGAIAFGVLASLSICGNAAAQFGPIIELPPDLPTAMPAPVGGYPPTVAATAAGPYLAPPAWGQTLAANVRFVILSNFNSDAVLDRETGLVWTRQTVAQQTDPFNADRACRNLHVARRFGWRLPTTAELLSLVDSARVPPPTETKLPLGHPFLLPTLPNGLTHYWANDHSFDSRAFVSMGSGVISFASETLTVPKGVLCVRGGEKNR